MRKHLKFAGAAALFIGIMLIVLLQINRVLIPKFFFDQTWSSTSSVTGIYAMEPDTVDVLFLGSSHSMCSFSPQQLYNEYGIRSYNRSSEQQNLLVSYYYLREALREHSIQTVVLDTYLCYSHNYLEPLNASESSTRKAVDYMKWSDIKREFIEDICKNDGNQSMMSYYFPNVRYHARWTDLEENDFTDKQMRDHHELKGFTIVQTHVEDYRYEPFDAQDSDEMAGMVPLMEEYLRRIVELCDENGVELILVSVPGQSENVWRYNTANAFAQSCGVRYLDFNEKKLYEEIGYDFAADQGDATHPNFWGAQKLTRKIGQVLAQECKIAPVVDEQWESTRDFYAEMVSNAELPKETDMLAYLRRLNPSRHAIFVAAKGDAFRALDAAIVEAMGNLGLHTPFADSSRASYYGIVLAEGVREEASEENLLAQGTFRSGRSGYEISSAGYVQCSIVIDGEEYAQNGRGLNFVVYDTLLKRVVDSVCFDTCDPALTASR